MSSRQQAPDPTTRLSGPVRQVVIGSTRLDADAGIFAALFRWRVAADTSLDAPTAARWGVPVSAGARSVTVRPADEGLADVRLVAVPEIDGYRPFRSPGWSAVELITDDLDTLMAELDDSSMGAGVEVAGSPAPIGDSGGTLRAAQLVLPGGAPVYVTEINGPLGAFELPRSRKPAVPGARGVFIAVAAVAELDVARSAVRSILDGRIVTDHALAVGVLNRAFDLAPTHRHRVSTVQLAGRTAIEFDQLPAGWTERPTAPGCLPPGIAVVCVEGRGRAGGASLLERLRLDVWPTA